jgi:acylphosphatase
MKTIQLNITGRVQGVFYRAEAQQKARELGLTGWVKNEADGSVTVVAQGDGVALDKLAGWCAKGPTACHVEKITATEIRDEKIYRDFQIQY